MKIKNKNIDGFQMSLYKNVAGISSDLLAGGIREPEFMWILKNEAKGELAIDIGANIGYTTLYLCQRMNRVIAIEPDKRSRKLLKLNIKNNGFSDKTSIHNFAISDKKGEHKIYYAPKPNLTTLNKPVNSIAKHIKGVIKTKTIDQLGILPDFVKMDIEGFEVEALLGGMDTFNKTPHCKILLEVHPQFYSEEHNFASVLEKLVSIGYRFKYITSAGISCPTRFKEKGYSPFSIFKCGEWERGIFRDIKSEDAIDFSTNRYTEFVPELNKATNKIVRAIMLEK